MGLPDDNPSSFGVDHWPFSKLWSSRHKKSRTAKCFDAPRPTTASLLPYSPHKSITLHHPSTTILYHHCCHYTHSDTAARCFHHEIMGCWHGAMRPTSDQNEITNLSHLCVMIDRGPIIDESGKGQEVDTSVIKGLIVGRKSRCNQMQLACCECRYAKLIHCILNAWLPCGDLSDFWPIYGFLSKH
jgi:hypothetical protein